MRAKINTVLVGEFSFCVRLYPEIDAEGNTLLMVICCSSRSIAWEQTKIYPRRKSESYNVDRISHSRHPSCKKKVGSIEPIYTRNLLISSITRAAIIVPHQNLNVSHPPTVYIIYGSTLINCKLLREYVHV